MKKKHRIAITGLGPISSVGIGKRKFWNGLLNKNNNINLKKYILNGDLWASFYAHEIRNFNLSDFHIDRNKYEEIINWKEGEEDIDLSYIIAAIKLSLDDSRLDYNSEQNNLALVLAHENLGLMPFGLKITNIAYDFYKNKNKKFTKKEFFEKFYTSFIKSGYDLQSFTNLFHIAKLFNIHNFSIFINNACASGLYAIETASSIIKNKQSKSVVIATSDSADVYKYLWFKKLGIYAEDGVMKPFSFDSKGLVFGDCAAAIVLEDYDYACARKARIYAEYLGGGFDLEGWKMTFPKIGSKSYVNAMHKALEKSGKDACDIDLFCPHGVGYPVIDFYESRAISDFFEEIKKQPFMTVFKPYFGHNLGGSALLETIALLLSMQNSQVLALPNYDTLDKRHNLIFQKKTTRAKIEIAMKTCCAFAGYNAAAVFRKID